MCTQAFPICMAHASLLCTTCLHIEHLWCGILTTAWQTEQRSSVVADIENDNVGVTVVRLIVRVVRTQDGQLLASFRAS